MENIRKVQGANVKLVGGAFDKVTVIFPGEFIVMPVLYFPPTVEKQMQIEYSPKKGYLKYILLDNWPIRYIFKEY